MSYVSYFLLDFAPCFLIYLFILVLFYYIRDSNMILQILVVSATRAQISAVVIVDNMDLITMDTITARQNAGNLMCAGIV